ncbi:MAG: gamma-glutamylcyclotransferase [Alphaproteobacteria bacterium]|nr:gamma-glutamylcyclotransferase [Alphaproteobacteria bacterium]MBP9877867.1 gamma-glutamylcyclotransferase [Alphaproteobacteria bacterium]
MPNLFSYGTLQYEAVQLSTFGRLLEGAVDALPGYKIVPLPIKDEAVIALSGEETHKIVVPSDQPGDSVSGMVFEVTDEELIHADAYEVDDYERQLLTMASGTKAWVYVQKNDNKNY